MSTEKTLKQENFWYIQAYTLLLIVVFWWFTQGFSIQEAFSSLDTVNAWIEKLLSATFLSAVAYIVTIVLNGLLSSKIKYILVFWRVKNTLPGHRAFSKLMAKEPRINADILINKYGELPQAPAEQNSFWYQIYKKYEKDKTVLEAQKNFLLMREMTAITCILIVSFAIISPWTITNWLYFFYYLVGLLICTILTSIAGRNYGKRLVMNVLAIDSIQ